MGVDGQNQVYLDLTHKDPEYLTRKLGVIMEIYEKFVGDDPRTTPMKIFPAVHYTMGGLWTQYTPGSYRPESQRGEHRPGDVAPVDTEVGRGMAYGAPNNMMTNISGLYAFGEVNFGYHGATRLGANALLSCIFDGLFCGLSVVNAVRDGQPDAVDQTLFDSVVEAERRKAETLLEGAGAGPSGDANPYAIASELGEAMTAQCTVVKSADGLAGLQKKLGELRERYGRVRISDAGGWTNQTLSFTRAVGDMLTLAELIAKGSDLRKESRGSHYRLDYPDRDDDNFLKTTVGEYRPGESEPHHIFYREVDTSLVKPRPHTYGKTEAPKEAKNSPAPAAVS